MTQQNPFRVRRAGPDDIEDVFGLAMAAFCEDALQSVSESKVRAMVEQCVSLDSAIAGVIDEGSRIVASIGLVLDSYPYSEDRHLAVRWLASTPEARRIGMVSRLLRFAKWASDSLHVPLSVSVLTTDDLGRKMQAYQRQIPQVGATFVWGDLPDRSFFDQPDVSALKKPEGTLLSGSPPFASGPVRQPHSPAPAASADGAASITAAALG